MPDTRWILPLLQQLKGRDIPDYPVAWVGVTFDPQEIVLIGFHPQQT